MQVKKSGGKIFGAVLTTAEKKALEIEMRKQFAELDAENMVNLDSIILWVLHEQFGFGEKRLKTFFDAFIKHYRALIDYYELDDSDGPYICREKLKEIGVDLDAWENDVDEKGAIEL